jgi:hypothetical protein
MTPRVKILGSRRDDYDAAYWALTGCALTGGALTGGALTGPNRKICRRLDRFRESPPGNSHVFVDRISGIPGHVT